MALPVRDPSSTVERFFQFSLLGMLASGFLALGGSGHLDWATQIALVAALIARAAKVSGWLPLDLSNRAIAVWTLAAVCFYPIDNWFLSGSGPAATLHLAVILTALKLFTAKSDRDYLYLKMIAVTELVAAAMLAVNLGFFVFLALFLLFAVATLASGEVRQPVGLHETIARAGQRAFRQLGADERTGAGGCLQIAFAVQLRKARDDRRARNT